VSRPKTNKKVSDLGSTNPKEVIYMMNSLYHARSTYLSPYRELRCVARNQPINFQLSSSFIFLPVISGCSVQYLNGM
jgi:hypothetical protein